mmetsp:Transcript_3422/g.11571  ORF Transcript_3422/g.11571 Transcript_3422/m.11571 type:complete len:241 (+) Transcript_3422:1302-2024(+)
MNQSRIHSGAASSLGEPSAGYSDAAVIASRSVIFRHCLEISVQNRPFFGSSPQTELMKSSQNRPVSSPQRRSIVEKLSTRCNPALSKTRIKFRPLISFVVASASRMEKSISVPFGSCMIATARWHALTYSLRTSFAMRRSISSDTPSANNVCSSGLITRSRKPTMDFPGGIPIIFPGLRCMPLLFELFFPWFRYFSSFERSCNTHSGPRSDHPCIITISHAIAVASFMSTVPNSLTLSGP